MTDITNKEIDEFMKKMRKRLVLGRKKYPNQLMKQNIFKEWEEELIDIADYAALTWKKLKILEERIRRTHKKI